MNSGNQKKLKIVLLRHGETIYNDQKRLQSGKDSLNEKGKEQIKEISEELKLFKFNQFISSDEKRAIESSEIISQSLRIDFQISSLIREKSSGNFADKLVSEVDWSIVKGSFLEKKIPGGESVKELTNRAIEFLIKLNSFTQDDTVLVVSHGTFLRVLISIIFNQGIEDYLLNYEFPNATYLVISREENGKWNLIKSSLIRKNK